MPPLVRSSQTGYWIPACAGMTDSTLLPSDHVDRSQITAHTVIPAKAGIQYADGGTGRTA